MDTMTMLRSHVERVLQGEWEVPEVACDEDGDYPFRAGTAQCWVSVLPPVGNGPASVRVFGYAAEGLKPSARLLRELNEINAASRWCRVYLRGGRVVVSRDLDLAATDDLSVVWACRCVADVASDIGAVLATVYGGTTPHPAEPEPATQEDV